MAINKNILSSYSRSGTGDKPPETSPKKGYMIRLPEDLHRHIKHKATDEGVSVSAWIEEAAHLRLRSNLDNK